MNIIWFFSTFALNKLKMSLFFPQAAAQKIFRPLYFTELFLSWQIFFLSSRFYYCSAILVDHENLFQNVLRKTCFVFENVFHFFPGALGRQHGVKASLKTAHSSRKKSVWVSFLLYISLPVLGGAALVLTALTQLCLKQLWFIALHIHRQKPHRSFYSIKYW